MSVPQQDIHSMSVERLREDLVDVWVDKTFGGLMSDDEYAIQMIALIIEASIQQGHDEVALAYVSALRKPRERRRIAEALSA